MDGDDESKSFPARNREGSSLFQEQRLDLYDQCHCLDGLGNVDDRFIECSDEGQQPNSKIYVEDNGDEGATYKLNQIPTMANLFSNRWKSVVIEIGNDAARDGSVKAAG
ncbi:hypothetical protein F0562_013681 [Nyssa sinensis]|uniref:Uncharacterized protein n=1 Tax=Nyssa sinensis TaxID=561372 RepID=A0A5J4ZNN5_9ASTE|nr:hypothetical protein F0562_013681 [Nyssa sinensis]